MRLSLNALLGKAKPVPIGDGFSLWSPVEIKLTDDPTLPYDLRLVVEIRDGKAVITHLGATWKGSGGPGLTGVGLRKVALGRILQNAYLGNVLTSVGSTSGDVVNFEWRTPGDDLETVAMVYRLALATGVPAVASVAEAFEISPSTARGRIARARAKGLLSPTVKGEARA